MDPIKDYIGDGVYAVFDGHGIWLHANDLDNPTDKIYLEPTVFEELIRFSRQCRQAVYNATHCYTTRASCDEIKEWSYTGTYEESLDVAQRVSEQFECWCYIEKD